MRYDQEYLKILYQNHTLEEFLELVNDDKIDDPYTRAIITTLKRSINNLNLQFNPIIFTDTKKTLQETNHPQP
jgi:hypothetical protein